jgi:hypothetical protein
MKSSSRATRHPAHVRRCSSSLAGVGCSPHDHAVQAGTRAWHESEVGAGVMLIGREGIFTGLPGRRCGEARSASPTAASPSGLHARTKRSSMRRAA